MSHSVCLNMVLFEDNPNTIAAIKSVIPIIDHWVIADIACDEALLEMIEAELAGIPGEIVSIEDDGYAESRNRLLEYSSDHADYLLLLNQHESLSFDKEKFDKNEFVKDSYFVEVRQARSSISTKELRFIRSSADVRYYGEVCEFLICGPEVQPGIVGGLSIIDSSGNRRVTAELEHNAEVLESLLLTEPQNPHTLFNLAKIKLLQDESKQALELFKRYFQCEKKIDDEWVWYALFSSAKLMQQLEYDQALVIGAYQRAYKTRPLRAEPLFELSRLYRQQDDFALASLYSSQAYRTPLPELESYDIDTQLYAWSIPAEHALNSQQMNNHQEVVEAANRALVKTHVPINIRNSLMHSRQRSVDLIQQQYSLAENEQNKKSNRIRLLIPFRNAAGYIKSCIETVQSQDYDNFIATFIDDASTDESVSLIPNNDSRIELIQNTERVGPFLNRFNFINSCDPEDIVFYLDGDDRLASDNVLSYINTIYQQYDCWLTYGQFLSVNGHNGHALPFASQEHLATTLERGSMVFPIHPITHRAGLLHKIKSFDPSYQCFKDDNGEWLFYASDAVLARPLFSLAGHRKSHYCNQALYIYTDGHAESVNVTNKPEQMDACAQIARRPRLPVLDVL